MNTADTSEMAMTASSDTAYMRRAIDLAMEPVSAPHPNPRVGCVIVTKDGVVAEGCHQGAGSDHAEIAALKSQGDFREGVMYVTLEPCATHGRTPPCVERILSTGISKVVMACQDPNPVNGGLGIQRLREAGIQTEVGLLERESRQVNRGFFSRFERGMPWVKVKTAATLDGQVATSNGESQWITGSEARKDVQKLRAEAAAVMTGIGTVLADNPRLNCRLDGIRKQPLRVIVDSKLRTPVDSKALKEPGDILIAVRENTTHADSHELEKRAEIVSFRSVDGRVDCEQIFKHLAEKEVNDVLVEAGPTLVGALLQAGLVDEMVVYLAPSILGSSAMGLAQIPDIKTLGERYRGRFTGVRQIGDDIRIDLMFNEAEQAVSG